MALIVEDGSGKVDADSYISIADANTYLAAIGETAWADYDDIDVKEPALRRATEYMTQVYRSRWQGARYSYTQALDWPRTGVARRDGIGGTYAQDEVPDEIVRACAKLALRAATGSLAPDIGRLTKREQVGPLSVEYMDGAQPYTRYREVDLVLEPFLIGGGAGSFTLRLERQ